MYNHTIPYSKQTIDETDIKAVIEVLRSDYLTQGPVGQYFEQRVSKYCGSRYAVSFNSATSALHSACLALDVEPSDIVWTTAISFVASANCAKLCGAEIEFVDVDPDTINLSIDDLKLKLQKAEKLGRLPKVIIPVHFAGNPVEMRLLGQLKNKYGFKIIEDASHALGASQYGEPIGNCTYSDITIFSFHAVKIVTSGEGGVAVTNDEGIEAKLRLSRNHGVTREKKLMENNARGFWYYEQIGIGFNYRLTDIQAALGLSQMDKVDSFNKLRNDAADKYLLRLKDTDVLPLKVNTYNSSSRHLFVVRFTAELTPAQFESIFSALRSSNVSVNHHYIPIYKHPFYKRNVKQDYCPEAERYYMNALSLPLYPAIKEHQIDYTVKSLNEAIKNACHNSSQKR